MITLATLILAWLIYNLIGPAGFRGPPTVSSPIWCQMLASLNVPQTLPYLHQPAFRAHRVVLEEIGRPAMLTNLSDAHAAVMLSINTTSQHMVDFVKNVPRKTMSRGRYKETDFEEDINLLRRDIQDTKTKVHRSIDQHEAIRDPYQFHRLLAERDLESGQLNQLYEFLVYVNPRSLRYNPWIDHHPRILAPFEVKMLKLREAQQAVDAWRSELSQLERIEQMGEAVLERLDCLATPLPLPRTDAGNPPSLTTLTTIAIELLERWWQPYILFNNREAQDKSFEWLLQRFRHCIFENEPFKVKWNENIESIAAERKRPLSH